MEKIDFINNQQPALNATNLNRLQQNVENDIGDLTDLETSDRDNLVEAINEAKRSGGDAVPIHSIFDYDGTTVPTGYEEVSSYSTTEVKTGDTWIDGKPIYRIVKSFATTTSKANNSATISISTLNVDNMINIYGSTSGKFMLLGDSQAITWDANNITIYFNNPSAYSVSGYITIEYTKTTDGGNS